jgi:transcriptional regulator with XRE-family HTH domain
MIRFKLWRLQERLTQDGAARKLGLGESTLALLESGRLRPTAAQLILLRDFFGEEADALFEPVRDRIEAQS